MHEASLYEANCFVTLTYAPEHLPEYGDLDLDAGPAFVKRLREHVSGSNASGIRTYGCAEYGAKLKRPHYHLLLFNYDFPDKVHVKTTPRGDRYYESETCDRLWGNGKTLLGDLTFESAAYVARYVTKKITGLAQEAHYEFLNEYGEYISLTPEKPVCVSKFPGIGAPWLEKFGTDTYPSDSVIVRGKEMKPPKYYDQRFGDAHPEIMKEVKRRRKQKATDNCNCLLYCLHETPESYRRRVIGDLILKQKFTLLERTFEK